MLPADPVTEEVLIPGFQMTDTVDCMVEFFSSEVLASLAPGQATCIAGSQFMSDDFQNEIRLLGIESLPAFVCEPEGNVCIERFFNTLKEQLLWVRDFQSIPAQVQALEDFRALCNQHWLIERLGF